MRSGGKEALLYSRGGKNLVHVEASLTRTQTNFPPSEGMLWEFEEEKKSVIKT